MDGGDAHGAVVAQRPRAWTISGCAARARSRYGATDGEQTWKWSTNATAMT